MEKGNGDIVFFILIFIAIGIGWLVSTNTPTTSTNFFSALVPVSSQSTSSGATIQNPGSSTSNTSSGSTAGTNTKPPVFKVTIDRSWSNPKTTTIDTEYVVVYADYQNTGPVSLAGWKIQSAVSGASYIIPQGVRVPTAGQVGTVESVSLRPGDRAIITSGRSPIGQSFLENKCTGYLGQFQNFYPSLGRSCPLPSSELPYSIDNARTYGDACFDYLNRIDQCTVATSGSIPNTLPQACQMFISTRLTYNGCMNAHRNDSDFFGTTWRLYLNREGEIWRDRREEIDLINASGVIVDSYSY